MKGKKLCAAALAGLLVLSGCSSSSNVVKDGDKYVVAEVNGEKILADELYESLMTSSSGGTVLYDYVLNQLISSKFPVTKDMEENAQSLVDSIESNYKYSYGSEYELYLESDLASEGYKSLDEYKTVLIETLQYSEFLKDYVKNNFESVFEDYYKVESPRVVSIIKVAMKDVSKPTKDESTKKTEVEKLLKAGKNFGEVAASYSDDTTASAKGNLGIVDSTKGLASSYGSEVEKKALALKEGETSEAIKGSDGYYYVHCSSTNKETIKKELTSVDLDSPLLVYDAYMSYLAFKTHEVKYNDEGIKTLIENVVKEALDLRKESRG